MFLQTLNIEWGQIDPKDNRRINVNIFYFIFFNINIMILG